MENECAKEKAERLSSWLIGYDLIYHMAAGGGREKLLFGDRAQAARKAFSRSLAGNAFPEIWFEVPLMGEPWFDLHVSTFCEFLSPDSIDEDTLPDGLSPLFHWVAGQEDARQLVLSWDVGRDDDPQPAVHLLVKNEALTPDFLTRACGSLAAEAYRSFRARIPKGWFCCYTGLFPGRGTGAVRVECIPSGDLQMLYADEPARLEEHLREAGLSVQAAAAASKRCSEMIRPPLRMEFQFDINTDGSLGETFSISVRFFAPPGTARNPALLPDGLSGELLKKVEALGLIDERWRTLTELSYFRRFPGEGKGNDQLLYCFPAFLKLKWRGDEQIDAKAYLSAGYRRLREYLSGIL